MSEDLILRLLEEVREHLLWPVLVGVVLHLIRRRIDGTPKR